MENPEHPSKASWNKARKGTDQKEGAGGGDGPCRNPGLAAEQKPHPRHTHLPAEAPQSALTGDACGHSRQRSCPRPESQNPPALHLRASWQEVERARSTSSRIIFSKKIAGLDANPVTPVPSKNSFCLECSFEDNTFSSLIVLP